MDSDASMHMISKKDFNSAEMDTLTKSCSPTIVITANGEVQTHEEAIVYAKELGIFLTMKVLGDTPEVLSLESFATNMDTHMTGSTVKNHISLKMVFEYSAIWKISYQSWFLVYLQLPQARLLQHPRILQVRKLIIQITIQQSSQVKVWRDKHGET